MSHATDGELHAFLDGALAGYDQPAAERLASHLEGCPDCRARLEREQTFRERAGEVLTQLVPVVQVPPFETITLQRKCF